MQKMTDAWSVQKLFKIIWLLLEIIIGGIILEEMTGVLKIMS